MDATPKLTPFSMASSGEIEEGDRDFVCRIMKLNANARPSARDLLQDKWFEEPHRRTYGIYLCNPCLGLCELGSTEQQSIVCLLEGKFQQGSLFYSYNNTDNKDSEPLSTYEPTAIPFYQLQPCYYNP
jgi:hypothetical protein